MLTRKKIEKLVDAATMRTEQDGATVWCQLDSVKFARLVEAEALRNVAQRFDRGYLDTLRVVGELKLEESAARRAAKEAR